MVPPKQKPCGKAIAKQLTQHQKKKQRILGQKFPSSTKIRLGKNKKTMRSFTTYSHPHPFPFEFPSSASHRNPWLMPASRHQELAGLKHHGMQNGTQPSVMILRDFLMVQKSGEKTSSYGKDPIIYSVFYIDNSYLLGISEPSTVWNLSPCDKIGKIFRCEFGLGWVSFTKSLGGLALGVWWGGWSCFLLILRFREGRWFRLPCSRSSLYLYIQYIYIQ